VPVGAVEVTIVGVGEVDEPERTMVVVLEVKGVQQLPMRIGPCEYFAILTGLQEAAVPRPMTHDLICQVMDRLDAKLDYVLIDDLSNGIYFAKLVLSVDGRKVEVDARPSDGIALALRTRRPVYMTEEVLARSGVDKPEEEG